MVLAQAEDDEPVEVCGKEFEQQPELADELAEGLFIRAIHGKEIQIRTSRNKSARIVLSANTHVVLTVIDGPVEANGTSWWQVESTVGEQGWVVESDDIAIGTALDEATVTFSDGWCALRPVRVAKMMLIPGELFGAYAWGIEFAFPVEELPEGALVFLDGNIVPTSEVNVTPEEQVGEDHTMFRVNIRYFAGFRRVSPDLDELWYMYDGEPEELAKEED